MELLQEIQLSVGEETYLKKGILTQIYLVYAGMPDPQVFSLAVIHTRGNNSSAHNLYWSRNTRQVRIHGREISVVDVSDQAIRLTIS